MYIDENEFINAVLLKKSFPQTFYYYFYRKNIKSTTFIKIFRTHFQLIEIITKVII